MDKSQILRRAAELFEQIPGNCMPENGTAFFEAPLLGFGSAADPLFREYKKPGVIGPWFMEPAEWLDGAGTVVSLFFPASAAVKDSNRCTENGVSSSLWSYARIEGQNFINTYLSALADWLRSEGIPCCIPSADPRFAAVKGGKGMPGYPDLPPETFGSNWSERHAAYVCGLGTFGLSKGLITKKGMAGRFGSILLGIVLPADERPYAGLYDYCIRCGACVRRCPVGAIDPDTGKDHAKCAVNVARSGQVLAPRYGCGLCQTCVPCESGIPKRETEI